MESSDIINITATDANSAPAPAPEKTNKPNDQDGFVELPPIFTISTKKNRIPKVSPEQIEIIRDMYSTGKHDTLEIANKLGISRQGVHYYIRTLKIREKMYREGIPFPKEPPFTFKREGQVTVPWAEVKVDYLNGMQKQDICNKYKIDIRYLNTRIYDHKWNHERNKNNSFTAIDPDATSSEREKIIEDRMERFMDGATLQLQKMLTEMDLYREPGKTMPMEKFEKLVKCFSTTCDAMRKLYKDKGERQQPNSNSAPGNGNLIRINVMNGAGVSIANQPAKQIK